ncbi:MAG TPA: EAL domain-containing protein [Gallionellaceae bacterium]|nr:EAL domain-containing protein [Gallionellaceae bacterium]
MQTDRGELERVAEEIGLTPDAVELRKAFLEFTQSDSEALSELHAYMEGRRVDEVLVELFYAHLLRFPQLQRFIPDQGALERLKHSQARYFRRLTAGDYGDDYILDRLRVGMAHQRAGLETQWYIGAYRKYLSFFLATLNDMPGMDKEKFASSLEALIKVVFLDLGLALDTYFHRTQQELTFMANHDVLTGLPNRNLLNDRIEQALLQAHRSGEGVAIFLIDLDRFRNVNDSLGHAVGDEVIVAVAARLGGLLREGDTLARLGDDEFVAMLPCPGAAAEVAERAGQLLQAIASPIAAGGQELRVSGSMGIAVYPGDGQTRDDLLKNADAAMLRAKEEGGTAYCFFQPAMDMRTTSVIAMETRLRRALEGGEFRLEYQLQVDIPSGRPVGAEALLRWDAGGGRISPAEFVPLAEQTGLIIPIGAWVLGAACRQAVEWNGRAKSPFIVAVNISARQLWRTDFVETVAAILEQTGCHPSWLELEITENAIMVRPEEAAATIRALAKMGMRISIDDFGTGYSSLSYLKWFPVYAIKIDRSFVHQMHADSADAAIVRAVTAMAHSLNMKVVGEGVEDLSQLVLLGRLGCDIAQGYYFSRPLHAKKVDELLSAPLPWMQIYGERKLFERHAQSADDGPKRDISRCRVLRAGPGAAICMVSNPDCQYILPFGGYCEHPLVDRIADAP